MSHVNGEQRKEEMKEGDSEVREGSDAETRTTKRFRRLEMMREQAKYEEGGIAGLN